MNQAKYSIEIKHHKKYNFKGILIGFVLLISAYFIQSFGLPILLVFFGLFFLSIFFEPIKRKLNSRALNPDVLDDHVIIEDSENFTIKNKAGWSLDFNKLSESEFKNYYNLWNNINGKTTHLFQIENLNNIYKASENVFTDFIEQEKNCVILQKLTIENYKLDSNFIIIQNGEKILDKTIGVFVISRVSKNIFEGQNQSSKIEIKLIENELT